MVFVGGFCTIPDVVGLFVEDGLLGWNGFPGYMRKVVRRGGGFFIKMGFWKIKRAVHGTIVFEWREVIQGEDGIVLYSVQFHKPRNGS